MNIGYACLNTSLELAQMKTFRLASYSDERLRATVENNLNYLEQALEFNKAREIKFFRISSDIVPFASHEVCTFPWQEVFKERFLRIGAFIKRHGIRVSFHPDQFVLINSPGEDIFSRSIAELVYQGSILDLMRLDSTHKLQIHVGGVYGDKESAMKRFVERYAEVPKPVQKRLIIENDDRLFSLKDCLDISTQTGIPIIFDTFHHECLNNDESYEHAFKLFAKTWDKKKDGNPMVDYSSQAEDKRRGAHTDTIDLENFNKFLSLFKKYCCDVMLEIKDKEQSALKALQMIEKKSAR